MFAKACLSLTLLLVSIFGYARAHTDLLVVTSENPLLQYIDNNQYKGPALEILNALLQESALTAKINFMPWARAFNTVKTEPNTLILGIIRTPARENQFHWIGIVKEFSWTFVSLGNNAENKNLNDEKAKKKKVAVVRDSNAFKELTARGFEEGKNLYVVATLNQMFNLFVNGRVDLLYIDPIIIKRLLKITI